MLINWLTSIITSNNIITMISDNFLRLLQLNDAILIYFVTLDIKGCM